MNAYFYVCVCVCVCVCVRVCVRACASVWRERRVRGRAFASNRCKCSDMTLALLCTVYSRHPTPSHKAMVGKGGAHDLRSQVTVREMGGGGGG